MQAAQVALVFDLDNTLVASHIDFAGMRQAVLREMQAGGVAVLKEELAWPVGHLAELAMERGMSAKLYERVWQVIGDYEAEGMAGATLEAGAREVTSALCRKGHPLAVLTNNSRVAAMRALCQFGLVSPFQAVLGREDVPRLKPAPDGVLAAAASLGMPRRVVVVGDSWIDGVAAHTAGALFVAVGPSPPGPEQCPVHASIRALPQLLEVDLL